jgi:hypothetical protein
MENIQPFLKYQREKANWAQPLPDLVMRPPKCECFGLLPHIGLNPCLPVRGQQSVLGIKDDDGMIPPPIQALYKIEEAVI